MSFGPRSWNRCFNIPIVIATERKQRNDGQKGSMSLCSNCQKILIKKFGKNYVTFKEIKRKKIT